jgi:hypothetical protein
MTVSTATAPRRLGTLVESELSVQLDGYDPDFDDAPVLDILRAHLEGRALRRPADPDAASALCWWVVDIANHWDAMLEAKGSRFAHEIEGLTRAEARRLRDQLSEVARWLNAK